MNISTELSIVPQQIAIRPKNEIDASVPRHILRNIELSSLITEFPVQTVIIEITPRKNNVGIIDMRYAKTGGFDIGDFNLSEISFA
jgi:hypothetical protein